MEIKKTEIRDFLESYQVYIGEREVLKSLKTEDVTKFIEEHDLKKTMNIEKLDPIKDKEIIIFIEHFTGIRNVEKSGSLLNEVINVYLDDRPPVKISKWNLGEFFIDYQKRCLFLESILGINTDEEINKMVDYLNGTIEELDIYHYSLYPVKTDFKETSVNKFSLHQLDEEEFQNFLNSHHNFDLHINSTEKIANYPLGNRMLLISKEKGKRRQHNESYHLFFDRLDEIYSNHTIVKFLFDYFFGNISVKQSSISTDSFPHSGTSSSSKFYHGELKNIQAIAINRIQKVITFLEDKLYYRLIIRAEIAANETFARCVLLRSVLDPFFEKNSNKSKINNAQTTLGSSTNRLDKTLVQSKLILKFLNDNGSIKQNLVSEAELNQFLRVRNKVAHPRPNASIMELHQLYDKLGLIREIIYEFVFIIIERNIDNSLDDFEIDTLL